MLLRLAIACLLLKMWGIYNPFAVHFIDDFSNIKKLICIVEADYNMFSIDCGVGGIYHLFTGTYKKFAYRAYCVL